MDIRLSGSVCSRLLLLLQCFLGGIQCLLGGDDRFLRLRNGFLGSGQGSLIRLDRLAQRSQLCGGFLAGILGVGKGSIQLGQLVPGCCFGGFGVRDSGLGGVQIRGQAIEKALVGGNAGAVLAGRVGLVLVVRKPKLLRIGNGIPAIGTGADGKAGRLVTTVNDVQVMAGLIVPLRRELIGFFSLVYHASKGPSGPLRSPQARFSPRLNLQLPVLPWWPITVVL